jgi:hypothetical protein
MRKIEQIKIFLDGEGGFGNVMAFLVVHGLTKVEGEVLPIDAGIQTAADVFVSYHSAGAGIEGFIIFRAMRHTSLEFTAELLQKAVDDGWGDASVQVDFEDCNNTTLAHVADFVEKWGAGVFDNIENEPCRLFCADESVAAA